MARNKHNTPAFAEHIDRNRIGNGFVNCNDHVFPGYGENIIQH